MTCIASSAHYSIREKQFSQPLNKMAMIPLGICLAFHWRLSGRELSNLKFMLHLYTFSMSGSHKIENQLQKQNIILFQVLHCQLKWIMPLLLLSTHSANVRKCKFKRQERWASSTRAQRRRLNHMSLLGALLEIRSHIMGKRGCIDFSIASFWKASICYASVGVN